MAIVQYFKILICITLKLSSAVPLSPAKILDGHTTPAFTSETAVDLGVDVTDDDVSTNMKLALVNATLSEDLSLNQYTDSNGHMKFLKACAKLYSRVTNLTLNPEENVIATIGATEALVIAFQSLTKPGDEWIIIEPFWPKFKPQIELADGVLRYSNLKLNKTSSGHIRGSDWEFDKEEFASLFNNKTRGILLNNPNNPSGKVYTRRELQFIADLAEKWNVVVISDEAHEWAVYEPNKIVRFGTLPRMFERTLTVGSASKSFNVAGWRIGWVYGPADLIRRLAYVHDFFVQNAPTPQQIAVAYTFEQEYKNYGKRHCHIEKNRRSAQRKRDFLVQALRDAGMIPIVPDGGYCMMATWPQLTNYRTSISRQNGVGMGKKFANWMTNNIGVFGFSVSNNYGNEHRHLGDDFIRFCYHKKNATLELAAANLMRLKVADPTW